MNVDLCECLLCRDILVQVLKEVTQLCDGLCVAVWHLYYYVVLRDNVAQNLGVQKKKCLEANYHKLHSVIAQYLFIFGVLHFIFLYLLADAYPLTL